MGSVLTARKIQVAYLEAIIKKLLTDNSEYRRMLNIETPTNINERIFADE